MDTGASLIDENGAFADLVRGRDPAAPVPSCPAWTLEQLVRHVGRGDRWCAQIVAERSMDAVDPRSVPGGKPPADPDGITAWLHEGPRLLLTAVERTGPQTPVWTFLGPRPAAWWIRRRLHETLVHRADAALAVGAEFTVDPPLAADAITEYLERAVVRAGAQPRGDGDRPLGAGDSLHLHATDPGLHGAGEWTVLGRPDGIAVHQEHGKATAALRGPARDLLLAMTRRADAAELGLELFGQSQVWDDWLSRTPF